MTQPLDDLYALIRQLETASPAPVSEFRFTREQWQEIRAGCDARDMAMATGNWTPDMWNPSAIYGVPVRIVDSVLQSTPYLHGWSWAGQPREPFRANVAGWYAISGHPHLPEGQRVLISPEAMESMSAPVPGSAAWLRERNGVFPVEELRETMDLPPAGSFREAMESTPVPIPTWPEVWPDTWRPASLEAFRRLRMQTPVPSISDGPPYTHTFTGGGDPDAPHFTVETVGPARDIIDAIDEAIACQAEGCSRPIPEDGPSDDFCSQSCQERWHAARSEPLVGYREVGHDFSGDAVRFNAPERPTGSDILEPDADTMEMLRQYWQRYEGFLGLPLSNWTHEDIYHTVGAVDAAEQTIPVEFPSVPGAVHYTLWATPTSPRPGRVITPTGSMLVRSIAGIRVGDQLVVSSTAGEERLIVDQVDGDTCHAHPLVSEVRPVEVDPEPADPMQRALELRRTRNTGPVQPQRPPRRLGPGRRR